MTTNLSEIRTRAEAATPGIGFRECPGSPYRFRLSMWHDTVPHDAMPHTENVGDLKYREDAELLSCARNDIQFLLGRLEAAERIIAMTGKLTRRTVFVHHADGGASPRPETALFGDVDSVSEAIDAYDEERGDE